MNASKPTKEAYFNYIGSIELPTDIWDMCPLSGAADAAIAHMRTLPEVIAELEGIDGDSLRKELEQEGAWDAIELSDHDENLNRILWIAACNIHEGMYDSMQ